jgi:hypothetical protein
VVLNFDFCVGQVETARYIISTIGIEFAVGMSAKEIEEDPRNPKIVFGKALKSGKFGEILPVLRTINFLPTILSRKLSRIAAKYGVLEYFDWLTDSGFEIKPDGVIEKAFEKSQWKVISFFFSKFPNATLETKTLFRAAIKSTNPKVLNFYFEDLGLKVPIEKKPNSYFFKFLESIKHEGKPYREIFRILKAHGLVVDPTVSFNDINYSYLDITDASWIKTDSFLRFLKEECKFELTTDECRHLLDQGAVSALQWVNELNPTFLTELSANGEVLKAIFDVFDNPHIQSVKYCLSILPTPLTSKDITRVLMKYLQQGNVAVFIALHAFDATLIEDLGRHLQGLVDSMSFDRDFASNRLWWDPLTWLNDNGYVPKKEILFSKYYKKNYSASGSYHFLEWLLRNGVELTPTTVNELNDDAKSSKKAQFILKLVKELRS